MGQSLKKHPGGRPVKYNRAILDKTMDYMDNYESYGDVIPQIAGLAQALEITRETIYQWINDDGKKQFSDMCRRVLSSQERKLVNGGLENKYNANVVKLMLSKHGYTDSDNKQGLSVNVTINRGNSEIEVNGQTLAIEDK